MSINILNMHYVIVIGLSLCLCGQATAQQKLSLNADSLAKVLQDSPDEREKIKAMQDLSDYWLYKDSAKALSYAQQALKWSLKLKDNLAIAVGYYYVGGVHLEHYHLPEAKKYYKQAITLLQKDATVVAQRYLAKTWHDLGAVYQREDNSEVFLKYMMDKAFPILERIGDSILLASDYYDVGNVFFDTKQYEKALSYFQQAAHIFGERTEYAKAVDSRLGITKTLLYQEDYTDNKVRQMETNLQWAYQALQKNPDAYAWLDYYVLNGLFQQYVKENFSAALDSYDKGLAFADKRQESYNRIELLNRKYYLFFDHKRYAQARQMAYAVYQENQKYPFLKNKLLSLKNLVDVEEASGNKSKAFTLLKDYVALADSNNKKQTNIKLNQIEQKYEREKKEKEIIQLRAENQLKSAALTYNKTVLTLGSVVLVCLLVLLFLGYRLFRNKQRLVEQHKQLHDEQLRRMKQQQQVGFYNAMIQGQEQERKRLAGDLHDGLGGLLSNIKLLLSKNSMQSNTIEAQQQHTIILNKLDAAVNELRRIARNMMPETLLRFGLVTALRDFCEDLERSGIKISLQTYGFSPNDDKHQQIMVYRILQELIHNAVRHADAKNILVQCIQNDEKVYVTVEDDGKGFDPQNAQMKQGIGLHNVRNRVAYLNGQLDIQSEQNVGTTINIEFNLYPDAEHIPTYS